MPEGHRHLQTRSSLKAGAALRWCSAAAAAEEPRSAAQLGRRAPRGRLRKVGSTLPADQISRRAPEQRAMEAEAAAEGMAAPAWRDGLVSRTAPLAG